MMLRLLLVLLVFAHPGIVQQVQCEPCFLSRTFADNDDVSSDGVEDFNVAPGASSTCTVSCDSNDEYVTTSLFLNYGRRATIFDESEIHINKNCNVQLTLTSQNEQYRLGYRLDVFGNDFTNLKLECTCTEEGDGRFLDRGDFCFPGSAMVETRDGGPVSMKDLQVGDWVFSGHNKGEPQFQPVYGFGHYQPTTMAPFLQFYTDHKSDPLLEVSSDHLIYISTKDDGHQYAARADTVQVGDLLVLEQPTLMIPNASTTQASPVTKITTAEKEGLYMPLTPDGTLVVSGVKVSNYVSLHKIAPKTVLNAFSFFGVSDQDLQHWWLAPHRMLCLGVSSGFCGSSKDLNHFDSEEGILHWLNYAKKILLFAEGCSPFVRIVLIGAPLFLIFGFFHIMELIFGPTWAPAVLLFLVTDAALVVVYLLEMRNRFFGQQLCEIRDHVAVYKPNKKEL